MSTFSSRPSYSPALIWGIVFLKNATLSNLSNMTFFLKWQSYTLTDEQIHKHAETNSTPVISSGRRPVEKDWHWQLWKIINIWMERRYLWPKKNQQQKKRPLALVVLQSSWRLERTPPQRLRRLGWTGKHRELPSYKHVICTFLEAIASLAQFLLTLDTLGS